MSTSGERPAEGPAAAGIEPSDHSLIRRFRHGNQEAATQLYLRYVHRLRALARANCPPDLARNVDVDDIVQSVFASFFQKVSHGEYDVPAGEDLWKLFLVIALNKIRAKGIFYHAAKRDVRLTVGGDDLQQLAQSDQDADSTAFTFLQIVLDEFLNRLPERHREMVVLRIEGYEIAEIAAKVKRSRRTVERVLQACRQKLAEVLHSEK